MPPKNASKGGAATSKKTENKKKEKTIEDRTFGLKNKKGAKQQKFVQQVQHQVKSGGKSKTTLQIEKEREQLKKEKEQKLADLVELNKLIKPLQTTVKGADPMSVVCAFFKQGTCGKGTKCKFSHDLSVEKKSAKKSIYVDMRDESEQTNEEWGTEELNDVIAKKHGKEGTIQTPIVCKFFLDAVENSKYGWFWKCPNGETCKYRHALPEGYQLKKDRKKDDKGKELIAVEDLIERQRAELCEKDLQILTLKTFLEWKRKKLREKAKQKKAEETKKKQAEKAKTGMSGLQMFQTSRVGVEDGGGEEEDEEGVDLGQREDAEESKEEWQNAIDYDLELKKYLEFEKNATQEIENEKAAGAAADAVAIDEDLFDDEDLDGLDEELDDLNLSS